MQDYLNVQWISRVSAILLRRRREVSDLTAFTFRNEKCSAAAQVRPALLLKPVPDGDEEVEFGGPRLPISAARRIDTSRAISAQLQ